MERLEEANAIDLSETARAWSSCWGGVTSLCLSPADEKTSETLLFGDETAWAVSEESQASVNESSGAEAMVSIFRPRREGYISDLDPLWYE